MRQVLALCLGVGCAWEAPPDPFALPSLEDTNPDPAIVEVSLVAAPGQATLLDGKPADVWTYRDASSARSEARIPGPLLDVPVGAHVIVHFTNQLPDPTTIHWHGLRVPNAADGTPIAQVPVAPGASFDYAFDATDAGTFWYHPHVAGDVQIERGLYGPIVVRGGVEPDVTADRVLVLDDVKLEATGQLSTTTDALDVMLGRQGNVLLVDGTMNGTIDVAAGGRERWRFINSANGRYFNLVLPGHTFLVIGWDGGMLKAPYTADSLLVTPGERYDVLVDVTEAPGTSLALQTIHYDRGHGIPDPGPQPLLTLRVGAKLRDPTPLPTTWATFAPIAVDASTPVRQLVLSEEEQGLVEPRFMINGKQYPDGPVMTGTSGATEIWEIKNDAEMDHPFHLHGMFFQVLDVGGVAAVHAGWKDTVNIPQKTTLRFAVRYGGAGRWMYHCHILEHAERGMMGELQLR